MTYGKPFTHKARQRPAGAPDMVPVNPRRSLCPLGCNPVHPQTGTPHIADQKKGEPIPKGQYGIEDMNWSPSQGFNQMAIKLRCEKCGKTWYEDKPAQQITTRALRARQASGKK